MFRGVMEYFPTMVDALKLLVDKFRSFNLKQQRQAPQRISRACRKRTRYGVVGMARDWTGRERLVARSLSCPRNRCCRWLHALVRAIRTWWAVAFFSSSNIRHIYATFPFKYLLRTPRLQTSVHCISFSFLSFWECTSYVFHVQCSHPCSFTRVRQTGTRQRRENLEINSRFRAVRWAGLVVLP
jgi:hypothetical protein